MTWGRLVGWLTEWTSREIERVKLGEYVQLQNFYVETSKVWKPWPNSPKETHLDMKKLIEIEGKIAKRLDAQKFWATLV